MAAGISDLAGSTWLTFLTAGPFYVLGLLAAGKRGDDNKKRTIYFQDVVIV